MPAPAAEVAIASSAVISDGPRASGCSSGPRHDHRRSEQPQHPRVEGLVERARRDDREWGGASWIRSAASSGARSAPRAALGVGKPEDERRLIRALSEKKALRRRRGSSGTPDRPPRARRVPASRSYSTEQRSSHCACRFAMLAASSIPPNGANLPDRSLIDGRRGPRCPGDQNVGRTSSSCGVPASMTGCVQRRQKPAQKSEQDERNAGAERRRLTVAQHTRDRDARATRTRLPRFRRAGEPPATGEQRATRASPTATTRPRRSPPTRPHPQRRIGDALAGAVEATAAARI